MQQQSNSSEPSVTVIMVPRERFSCTPTVLDALYTNTAYPFKLICVDGNSPPAVHDYLLQQSHDRGFRLIRTEHFVSPNQARNLGLVEANSDWIVFLDNDCVVQPGWLSAMVRCAIETDASVVSPVYFEGSWADQRVHMAGGTAGVSQIGNSRFYVAKHCHEKSNYAAVREQLHRGKVELFEMHCVMLSMQMLKQLGPLDEKLLSAFEHDDLSLLVRQAGGAIFLEPEAHVTYTFGALDKYDAAYARLRWSDDWNRRTVEYFRTKWLLDQGWGADSIDWCNNHRRRILRETHTLPNRVRKTAKRVLLRLIGSKRFAALPGDTREAAEEH